MILGFKRQFAQYVREGSKTHTIRDDVKDRWHVGCFVDAFVDPRQKTMERLMPSTPCVRTERIEIHIHGAGVISKDFRDHYEVKIDGVPLSNDEKSELAWRDGFRDGTRGTAFERMMFFWNGRVPFKGKIIHWKYPGTANEHPKSRNTSPEVTHKDDAAQSGTREAKTE
jgi:hypothetical protein